MAERSSNATFAGRDEELDLLNGLLAALATTGARTVLIGGEAGIGKTRLVEEFRDRARGAGALVAAGVCSPAEGGGLPYGPIVGVLRDLSRQLDEATADAILNPVRHGLGLLDTSPAPLDSVPTPSEMGKTRLFEALLVCFTTLAQRSPVVVVFEDLHWADSASVEVIDFLTRNLGDSTVLLVGTHRREDVDREQPLFGLLAEFARHGAVREVGLNGLDRDATAALMAGILGRTPPWSLLEAVHSRCEGNPFFAEELTAARDATSLPFALRKVVMLRVERLPPAARAVVELVAIAGASVDDRLLAATADLATEGLRDAIVEAVALHVLTVEDGSRLRLRHALQREAVCDAMLPLERVRLHRRLAVALTEHPEFGATGPGHAAVELAGHWWEANEWSEALPASLRAGDVTAALLAMPEAHAQYEHAVLACEQLPQPSGRATIDYVDLLLKAAQTAYLTGALERSIELVNIAIAEIDPATDMRVAAVAFTMLGRYVSAIGDAESAFAAFHRVAQLLPSDPPSVELAAVIAEEARSLLLTTRDAEAEARSREAIAVARTVGARAEECHALTTLGAALAEHGDDAGIAFTREAVAIAEELGRPDLLDLAYKILAHVLMTTGRLEEAAEVALDGMALDEQRNGVRLNAAGQNSAEALIRLGRWDAAAELLGYLSDHGVSNCVFGPYGVRAMLDIRRGRFEQAAEFIRAADGVSSRIGTVSVTGWFHILRAELALEEGRPEDAYAEIESALAIAAGTDDRTFRPEMCAMGARALADEYEVARARGRRIDVEKYRRLAAALVEEAETHVLASRPGQPPPPPRALALVALCAAEESRLRTSDPDRWDRAAARWDDASEPYFSAYCRWREAEATLAARGGRRRATDAAQAAWAASVELGARPLQTRVERLAQRARITLAAAGPDPGTSSRETVAQDLGLTAREIEVLAQLALGRTDRQIADELFISRKTVSVHVSNILRKLDAANRVEAAEIGARAGLH